MKFSTATGSWLGVKVARLYRLRGGRRELVFASDGNAVGLPYWL